MLVRERKKVDWYQQKVAIAYCIGVCNKNTLNRFVVAEFFVVAMNLSLG